MIGTRNVAKMNKKERMKEEVISDDDFVDTRNFVKMNRKEKMKPQIISDDEVSDEVTFIDKIISDDEFVDNDKGSKKTGATSSDKLCGELKKQKRFRSLSTVPTKNLESKLEKELSPKQKHTVKPQKSINSLKEITLTDPDTSSSFVSRRSERIAANASVLEKSSIYFSPGQTDPRVKAIAARTKSALLSCDAELKERASKGDSSKRWDRLFDVFGSMIEERELTVEDWEESALVWKFDQNVMDPRLLDDSCSDSDEEFEIVNPDDKFERSSKEANGKELADFITGQSNAIKKKLVQPRETKTAAHISGSMSLDICKGKFSNFKNTMTVKVFGLDLKFSKEYLDMLKAMTGVDMRSSAYQIQINVAENGVPSTVQILNDAGKELRNTSKLNDVSLVNQSTSSELNTTIKSKRLLRMLTPVKRNHNDSTTFLNDTEDVKNETEGCANPNNSMQFNTSTAFNRSKLKTEPSDPNLTFNPDTTNNLSLSRKKAFVTKMLTPKLKSEPSDPNLTFNPDTTNNLSLSRKKAFVTKMLTPKLKSEPSDPNLTFNPDTTNNVSLSRKRAFVMKMLTPIKPKREDLSYLSIQNPTKSEPPSCAFSRSTNSNVPVRMPPGVERCRSYPDLSRAGISPLKRNHNSTLNVTHEGSPSKRIRFHDDSILSSTRIDDSDWKQDKMNAHSYPDGSVDHSSRVQPVNHRLSVYGDHVEHCNGPCCQPPHQQYNSSSYSLDQHHHHPHQVPYLNQHLDPYNAINYSINQQHHQPRHLQSHQQHSLQHTHLRHQQPLQHHHQMQHQQPLQHHHQLQQQQPFQHHLPQHPHHSPNHSPAQQSGMMYSPQPHCTGDCCRPHPHSVPGTSNHGTHHSGHQTFHAQPPETGQMQRHFQDSKHEKKNIPESKYLVPKDSFTSDKTVNNTVKIPIVTELLRGLNSSKRKLRIKVDYDVKLADSDDDDDKENSY